MFYGILQDNTDILKSAVPIKYLSFCLSDQKVLWLMSKCLQIFHEYLQWDIANNSRTTHSEHFCDVLKKSLRKNVQHSGIFPVSWQMKAEELGRD